MYFDLVNVQRQDNDSDCPLANATELTKHRDPVLCSWRFQKIYHYQKVIIVLRGTRDS